MKKDTMQKLREKNDVDLLKDLQNDKDKLWQLRVDLVSGKVKNISEIQKLRKNIAVTNTILKEKSFNK